jgi:hypothetical protein
MSQAGAIARNGERKSVPVDNAGFKLFTRDISTIRNDRHGQLNIILRVGGGACLVNQVPRVGCLIQHEFIARSPDASGCSRVCSMSPD